MSPHFAARISIQTAALGLAATLVACGGGGTSPDPSAGTAAPPSIPVSGGAATGNGCWDLDFLEAAGRHLVVESRSTNAAGSVISLLRQESRVLGQRAFEGHLRLATDTTITLSLPSGQATSVQRNIIYTQRAADAGVTVYGDEGTMTAGVVTSAFKTVFNPAWTDTQHSLAPGQTVDQSWSGTSTSNGVTLTLQGSRSIRFVAQETTTVPAGTFSTCRFEQTQPGQPGPVTTWIARKFGAPVQVQSSGNLTQALRLTVDGTVVTAN